MRLAYIAWLLDRVCKSDTEKQFVGRADCTILECINRTRCDEVSLPCAVREELGTTKGVKRKIIGCNVTDALSTTQANTCGILQHDLG